MSHADLGAIFDPTVRHQVQLLMTQNRSLKSQLDILKQVRGAPVIRLEATHPDRDRGAMVGLELTESEVAALADFVAPRRLQQRGLKPDENGVLRTRDGKDLSDPGFLDALQKVLEQVR